MKIEQNITKEEFMAAYPDLFALIEKEAFEKGVLEGIEKGRLSGAESERERIKGVEEQLLPGHEELIASLKFDGKTTGAEAAVLVLKAERELMGSRHNDLLEDGKKAKVKESNPPDLEGKKEKDPAAEMDALVKAAMKEDKGLSYLDALKKVQAENRELAQKIVDRMSAARSKSEVSEE